MTLVLASPPDPIDPPTNPGLAAAAAASAGVLAARRFLTDRSSGGVSIRKTSHMGSPAAPADSRTHQAVERVLYRIFPDVVIIGEEVDREGYIGEDTVLALLDPIDGTDPGRGKLSDFSSVVILYRLVAGHLVPWAAAIAGSDLRVSCVDDEGTIGCHDIVSGLPVDLFVLDPNTPGDRYVAYVGSKEKHHWMLPEISEICGGAVIFNTGGSPTISGLLVGELAASLALSPQTPWDAAHLLIGRHAGLPAVLIAEPDFLLTVDEVVELFTDPPMQVEVAEEKKVIPPFVIGHDPAYVTSVARGLRGSRLVKGI
ncbi:MAG TPA: hypothetical protein VF228_01280 [Iamia sp.]